MQMTGNVRLLLRCMYDLLLAQHPSIREQGIGVSHLRALAALPNLSMLNLARLPWAEDAIKLGPGYLVARLPHLRVLNASQDVLVRPCCLPASCAQLHGLLEPPEPLAVPSMCCFTASDLQHKLGCVVHRCIQNMAASACKLQDCSLLQLRSVHRS